jgi:hypothetical protein
MNIGARPSFASREQGRSASPQLTRHIGENAISSEAVFLMKTLK